MYEYIMKEEILFMYDIINPFFGWPRLVISYILDLIYTEKELSIEEETYSENDSEESVSDIEDYEDYKELKSENFFEKKDD